LFRFTADILIKTNGFCKAKKEKVAKQGEASNEVLPKKVLFHVKSLYENV